MGFDAGKLKEPVGILRIISVFCVLIALCCWYSYSGYYGGVGGGWGWWGHDVEAFTTGVIICFIFSLILLILVLVGVENDALGMVDKVFHICAAVYMIIVSIVVLVNFDGRGVYVMNREFQKAGLRGYFDNQIASVSFGLIYGVLCAVIAGLLFKG